MLPDPVRLALHQGRVIPAHPLALDARRRLDECRQRALTRYYIAAGAGGVAACTPPSSPSAIPKWGCSRPCWNWPSR